MSGAGGFERSDFHLSHVWHGLGQAGPIKVTVEDAVLT